MRKYIILLLLLFPLVSFSQPRKDFKNGTFGVKISDTEIAEDYVIIRKGRKQIERHSGTTSEYRIKWVSDYFYKLTLVESTRADFTANEVTVNILSVRENEYTALGQSSVFGCFKVIIFRIDEK